MVKGDVLFIRKRRQGCGLSHGGRSDVAIHRLGGGCGSSLELEFFEQERLEHGNVVSCRLFAENWLTM